MKVSKLVVLAVAVVSVVGCQTLTEELPSQPTANLPPIPNIPPVVVVPVPIPVPEAPSGGAPIPPPNLNPNPLPPSGGGGGGGGGNPSGQIPNNTSPVTKVGAKVYFLECGGQQVPNSEFATQAQVGCRIHFDCTPKDANNNPTQAQSPPSWTFNGPVSVGNVNDFTPTVTAQSPGNLTAWVTIDGVQSNTLNVQITN